METCYGGTDVMERSCAVARGIGINTRSETVLVLIIIITAFPGLQLQLHRHPALILFYDMVLAPLPPINAHGKS
jgi:hypothetical protein